MRKEETHAEEIFSRASQAIGTLVGVSESVEYLCKTMCTELSVELAAVIPEIDDRCLKNYALLISFAEKVNL